MAGSIEHMTDTYVSDTLTFTFPSPPAHLIEDSNVKLTAHKFLNIGLDPTNDFNIAIHLMTPPRLITISENDLKLIFRFMEDIKSLLLDESEKNKEVLLLESESESITISRMVYQSENTIVIKSKIQNFSRAMLNLDDLLLLQDQKCAILEMIEKKKVTKPFILQLIDQIASYLKSNIVLKDPTFEDMRTHVLEMSIHALSSQVIDNDNYTATQRIIDDYNNDSAIFYTSELKLFATNNIVKRWMEKLKKHE